MTETDKKLFEVVKEIYEQGYICGINNDDGLMAYVEKIKDITRLKAKVHVNFGDDIVRHDL